MSTTVTEMTQGQLHIDSGGGGTRPDPEAWKKLIGGKPVPARLSVLPETKVRRGALLTSTLFQVVVAALLIILPIFFPEKLATTIMYEVTPLATPQTEVPLPPKKPILRAKARPIPPPVKTPPPQQVAKLYVPRELMAPLPKRMEMPKQQAPRVNESLAPVKFESNNSEPVRPRAPVKTGLLTTGSVAHATISRPVEKVQTGGFGDPHGLPGPSNPNRRANIAHFGSPALPPGPGYGNGSGGAHGARGVIASAGFGNGVAIPPSGARGPRGVVRSGGFAAAVEGTAAPKPERVQAAPAVQPVTILAKPDPVYTAEARKLGIEGEVLVQVVFPASGPLRVIRVVKGLGHGLDEAAVRAAEQIRFKPALEDGKAVDFPATVHIVFQLAY
jgi:TonB family protein